MNYRVQRFFKERPLPTFEVDPQVLRRRTRRDVLWFGAGAVAALAGAESPGKVWLLNTALHVDDEL